jgi:CRP-like cAMP-binding protein
MPKKMNEHLKRSLRRIHPIPDPLMEDFLDLWELHTAVKKERVTEIDRIERYLYYIIEGSQKAYFINDGKEFIVAFSYPYAFTCIPESFLTQKPSKYCWQCIEESKFLRISYSTFFSFIKDYPVFETLLWKKLIGTVNGLVERYHRLLAYSMEERFRDLMKNSPELINRIPQKDLANYLKIDPTNFSKLINTIKV